MPPELARRPISFTGLKTLGVVVGLGEARVLKAGPRLADDDALVAFGLGSCVALCLWDGESAIAGMAHVVLPGVDPQGAPNPKFARSALPALMSLMRAHGATADPRHLVARLAGGAQVLVIDPAHGITRIGNANAQAVVDVLIEAGVAIEGSDLGGSQGRSVWFDPREGGRIRVRAIGSADHYV
jgi:chemotaxis protein CheD